MAGFQFEELALWQNLLIFAGAALAVWLAGTRVASHVDEIARRTGLGEAFLGALLLGGITSLPEGATTVAASAIGNAPLAANNLFGGIAMQMAILALADAVLRGGPLSGEVRDSTVLLQGVLLVALLALAAAGILAGDILVLGVGLWTTAVLMGALSAFYLMHRHTDLRRWRPAAQPRPRRERRGGKARGAEHDGLSATGLAVRTVALALLILGAGVLLARTADVLAVQTGLGAGFTGVTLVAMATSLPEVSTTLGAVRLGAYAMAISNVIGANILDTAILFLADAVYPGGPVLNELGPFAAVAALLGVLVTSVYLTGIVHRQRETVIGVGADSLVVALLYLGGLGLLYALR